MGVATGESTFQQTAADPSTDRASPSASNPVSAHTPALLSELARYSRSSHGPRSVPSVADADPYLSGPGSQGPAEIAPPGVDASEGTQPEADAVPPPSPVPAQGSAPPAASAAATRAPRRSRRAVLAPEQAVASDSAATRSPRRGRPRQSVLAPEQVVATAQSPIPNVEASAQAVVLAPEQTARAQTVSRTDAQGSVLAPEQTTQAGKRKNRRSQATKPETALVLAPEQTEILPADAHGVAWLPGEKHIDETLLDDAVAALNQIYLSKSQELHETLGDYLVQTFFSGDVTLFDSRERHHQTWRALSKREDLHFVHSTLWYAVAIRHQALGLTEEMVRALPVTHQRHLTHVRDPEQKQILAERVVAEGLSERQLRDAIVDIRPLPAPDAPRRGRPPLARLQKQLGVVSRALGEGKDLGAWVEELPAEAVGEVLAEVREMVRRLELVVVGLVGRG